MRRSWREQKYREEWLDSDDIYNEVVVEELLEDDELTREEEAFMRGYDREYEEELEDYY